MDIEVSNASEEIKEVQRNNGGELPKYAWPGGYPIFYIDRENNVLCVDCAKKNDEYSSELVAHDINYEDGELCCMHCGNKIESAFGDGE